jgi:hypothetical protein
MTGTAQRTHTFPSARIESQSGGLPVEVTLVAQLGVGEGDRLFADTLARQQAHGEFVDALDEPSARLAGTDFDNGESTALFSFSVGPGGHPFHRHAGHRVFTAISGSAGARLRFSTASQEQLERDPGSFIAALRHVDVPPDCLFTVRFGSHAWHQFAPLHEGSPHPVLFALSCHTNELGGPLDAGTRERVLSGQATIASLTELLPATVTRLLQREPLQHDRIPTVALSLVAPAGSFAQAACHSIRSRVGGLRAMAGAWRRPAGFVSHRDGTRVEALEAPPQGSLLHDQLADVRVHHQDTFRMTLRGHGHDALRASDLLADLLQGFIAEPPGGVSLLMRVRNWLVKPLGLRTSPLGCPVSSLLSAEPGQSFGGRFPVLGQSVDPSERRAQVVLGADDRHLRFRSCVGVHIVSDSRIDFTLGTRVHCSNAFGRFYMAAIGSVHRNYVTPAMLRAAVAHASAASPAFERFDGLAAWAG